MRVLILALLLASTAGAQDVPETGRIAGVVTEAETGEPLPGASVRLSGTLLGASADSTGRFSIEGVPMGEHEVEALFVGAEPWRATVRVEAGEAVCVWPKVTFIDLCDCVVVALPPEPISRGVYQGRVVEYLGIETSCCTWRTVRRDAPAVRWATR